jgi:MFS family permease
MPRPGRLVEKAVPAVLGRDFRWLWGQSTITNLGDGILLSAGPLLVTTITREPLAVAMAVFLQQLPWVVFGIPAGAIIDRVDRRRLTILVNVLRGIVLLALTASVASGTVNLAIVLGAVFLIGTAETFSDNASGALLAMHVPKVQLGLANSRLSGTSILANQLGGPPIGALLFGIGMALPFGVDATCALLGAVLVSRISTVAPPDRSRVEKRHIRHEIADGVRWLWQHPPIRALFLTILFFNITFGASMAVYVLFAQERLGLNDLGFGILITAGAVGGLIGSAAYPSLERRFPLATLMRFGLLLETVTHLVLALTTSAIVAGGMMTVFGIHAVVWGTTSTTVRQRAVPAALLGRVTSVYMLGNVGGSALGVVIGGLIAQRFGVTAPFWFAFFGSAVLLALIWRTLDDIAHAPTAAEAA